MKEVKNMNDEEFRKLEKKYYDEVNHRENITRMKNRLANVNEMLEVLTNDNPYTTISEVELYLTTVTSIDGNCGGYPTTYEVKLSKDLASKVLTQIKEELQTEIDNEVNRGY